MRWWLRSVLVGAAVGLVVGAVVGGLVGRIFMRILALAEEDALGLSTAMGAIVGDFTAGGTFFVAVFGGFFGALLGIAYVAVRPLLPPALRWRGLIFTIGTTALLTRVMVTGNLEDFSFLPVTLSLVLIAGSAALTALPVPVLVERWAPDRERRPGRVAYVIVGAGLAVVGIGAVLAAASAYAVEPLY